VTRNPSFSNSSPGPFSKRWRRGVRGRSLPGSTTVSVTNPQIPPQTAPFPALHPSFYSVLPYFLLVFKNTEFPVLRLTGILRNTMASLPAGGVQDVVCVVVDYCCRVHQRFLCSIFSARSKSSGRSGGRLDRAFHSAPTVLAVGSPPPFTGRNVGLCVGVNITGSYDFDHISFSRFLF
jgi:hypothetical protein